MRVDRTLSATIPALALEKKVTAVKVRPPIDAGLRDCLKQNPSGVILGGPLGLGQIGATSGFSLGSPVLVDRNLEFLPLFNPKSAVDLVSAVSAAAESPSLDQMKEVVDKALEFADQLPESVAVHVIGFLRPAASAVSALRKPGPKNKLAVSKAVAQSIAALVRLFTDLPGLESAKPYAEGLSVVLKAGEQIFVVSHAEVIRSSSGALVTTGFST
jgi:hypothetical protein